MNILDAKGKNCPIPVIMAKKEIEGGAAAFAVDVDNETAVRNLKKLAQSRGFAAEVTAMGSDFRVAFAQTGAAPQPEEKTAEKTWAVFVGSDIVGRGDAELGGNLMRMYFYTILQEQDLPSSILFMNAGVKLPTLDEQVVEHLKQLEEKGVEILVCGTCLNFFGIADQLKVGIVSNMYDITQRMLYADKVVSL